MIKIEDILQLKSGQLYLFVLLNVPIILRVKQEQFKQK